MRPRDVRWAGRRIRAALAVLLTLGLAGLVTLPASAAAYVPISGSGSTWSSNAVQQWASNVRQFGMTINFQASGSSQGRKDFYNRTVDFAVSEIPYGLTDNGQVDTVPNRGFAYMPIVAGGTSFMYHLTIGTKRVNNLRLSGDTIAKIFTGLITHWNDPAIQADNPALARTLPARKIIPVVRSDGSGTTAQFTLWLSKQYQKYWDPYCARQGRKTPCGLTSFFPAGNGFVAQPLSTGVAGYVAQDSSEGAITYVEYSYAQLARFPVVKLLNRAGYYVLPTAKSVAVALLQARIQESNPQSADYLTQILDGVYASADNRAYPLSSYSYMIVPTQVVPPFDTQKGNTLGAFAYYFLCDGQQQAPQLGYSPLPRNLVAKAFDQVSRIPGVGSRPNIDKCNNPTFAPGHANLLADTAPHPPACDKQGSTQCTESGVPVAGGSSGSGSSGSGGSTGATGAGAGTGKGSGTSGATGSMPTSGAAAVVDPDTGQTLAANAGDVSAQGEIAASPVSLSSDYAGGGPRTALMALAAILLLGVTVGPPLIARRLDRGGRQ